VVKYLLEMKKAAAASTVSTVRNAIVENSGKFAGYSVDVNSIQASCKWMSYYVFLFNKTIQCNLKMYFCFT